MPESIDRDILTLDEAAALLGVSVKTFNKVLHTQSLPARKIGREWKFSRQALIEWVGAGRSDDFYRESGGRRNGAEDSHPSQKTKQQADRRTSGWRLELD